MIFNMILWRSVLFNILFFGATSLVCLIFIPALFMPRKTVLAVTRFWVAIVAWLEKYVIGLTYEVRGQEYIPVQGSYIVASKHQSAYETLKLHHLFKDPTIVLKQELLKIPLFGRFLKKLDVIAINRTSKEDAINSIIDGARRMQDQNRAIVIFPQGTRVHVATDTKTKPYKGGIVKMYKNTEMPIIPLALNSGMFWARNSFIKKPGKVIFEFLPPIETGLDDKKVMKALEQRLEDKSLQLMIEAKADYPYLETPPQRLLTAEETK